MTPIDLLRLSESVLYRKRRYRSHFTCRVEINLDKSFASRAFKLQRFTRERLKFKQDCLRIDRQVSNRKRISPTQHLPYRVAVLKRGAVPDFGISEVSLLH